MVRQKLGDLEPSRRKKVRKPKNFTEVEDKLTNVKTYDEDLDKLRKKKITQERIRRIKRLNQQKSKSKDLTPGVVYLGHIPHGFTESGMREYFSQFGDVGRIRIACSRKTNRSKGYAYIEFKCDEVAKVVAETMNNYFMFEKLLKCVFIPKEEIKGNLFHGHRSHQKLAFRKSVEEFNKPKSKAQLQEMMKRRISNLEKKRQKLAEMGINLKFTIDDCKEVKNLNSTQTEKPHRLITDSISQIKSDSEESSIGDENLSFGRIFSITDATDSSKHTLELDSTDDEISFTTPPNARKVYKAGKKPSVKRADGKVKTPLPKPQKLRKKMRVHKNSTPKFRKNSFSVKDF